jgi:hypothetical protein
MTLMNELYCNSTYYTSIFSVGVLLLYKFYNCNNSKKTNKKLSTLGFDLIELFNTSRSWLNKKTKNISSILVKKNPKISFILEGKEIANYKNIDEITYTNKNINNYDLILYQCSNNKKNIIRLNDHETLLKLPKKIIESKVKFFSIQLIIKNKGLPKEYEKIIEEIIDSDNESANESGGDSESANESGSDSESANESGGDSESANESGGDSDTSVNYEEDVIIVELYNNNLYPFFLVGNILLDREFLFWFLEKYHNIRIDKDTEYKCSILTNEYKQVFLSSNEALLIEENSYTILDKLKEEDEFLSKESFNHNESYISSLTKNIFG